MKITFKRKERQPGLAGVSEGPRGWDIRLDGNCAGSISYISRDHKENPFTRPCSSDPLYVCVWASSGCPHINTCHDRLFDTPEEAKAFAKNYIKENRRV